MTGTDMTLTPKTQKTPETLEPTGLPYTVGTEWPEDSWEET